jgi:hypothetical protein
MIIEEKITDEYNEKEALQKSRLANFRTLGNKYFEADRSETGNPISIIKENLQLNKLSLPSPYDENLLNYELAQIYWVTSASLVTKLESHLKASAPKDYVLDYFNYIKEFYFKWAIIDAPVDKKYFAVSALNAIKQTHKENFITNSILHSVILIFEKSLFNAVASEEQLQLALSLSESIEIEESYKQELSYVLNIFYGFLFLKQNNPESAIEKFNNAQSIKPDGVNANFYLALSSARINDIDAAENYIRKVYEADQKRIAYSIENNNSSMLKRFVHKPYTSYFFEFNEFANFIDVFRFIKERNESIASVELNHLRGQLLKLKEIRISEFYDNTIAESHNFLETVLQFYHGTENIFVIGASSHFVSKFHQLVENIRNAIKLKAYAEVSESLKVFDKFIEESNTESHRLQEELDLLRDKLKLKLSEKSERVVKMIASTVSEIEHEIQNLDMIEKFNHKFAFNNSLTYSIIISSIIFMIGGLAGYANSGDVNAWDFKSVMSIVFSEGLKWAAVSFFVGTLISFILAASTLFEKSNRKMQLMKEIGAMKNSKEQEIETLKHYAEAREKTLEERYKRRIKEYSKRAEDLKKQKAAEEENLKESLMRKYWKLDEQLDALLN